MTIDLLQDQCDPLEFMVLLGHLFGRYEIHGLSKVVLADQQTGRSLTITYIKRRSLNLSGDLTEERQGAIRDDVRRFLIDNQDPCIAETVAYASKPVRGQFTLKDHFQILPIPEGFIKPESAYGAENPFLLRFTYTTSPELLIDGPRWHRAATKYATLLNTFLDASIQVGPSWPGSGWVVDHERRDLASSWRQLGFMFPGQNGKPGKWNDNTGIPELERVPHNDYYHTRDPHDRTLRIPSNFEASLTEALALDGKREACFARATRWLYQSVGLWRHSQSAALIALVSALESLLEPVKSERCAACKQPQYQISQRFKHFLNMHVPGIDSMPKERDDLYRVRSKLVHGSSLLERDLDPAGLWLNLRVRKEVQLHERLELITTIAVHNWLHTGESSTDDE